ncbi:MAG: hypothetical protein WC797_04070 [Candidatus Paceibacterota bacterium]|jgi:hypothetical protein
MRPTVFVTDSIVFVIPDGRKLRLWLDGSSKITVGNGDFEHPVANAFSLLPKIDCPFATETCKSICYVIGLEKMAPEVFAVYSENSKNMRIILSSWENMQCAAVAIAEYIKVNCPHGFRWHVAGDIISAKHACFIRETAALTPGILHWIYTRSFSYVEDLLRFGLPNLVVNLSADRDNWSEALATAQKYNLRICYLSIEGEIPLGLPDGSVIMPNYNLRGRELDQPTTAPWWQTLNTRLRCMVCPADFFGQDEHMRCGRCKKCLVPCKKAGQP